ncbi:MAG TPA: hypothetical protein VMM17_09190 [Gemmatimonadaceae bacterium]|nr:hypothetical protein [Gemmatimonadaceae bacterium]
MSNLDRKNQTTRGNTGALTDEWAVEQTWWRDNYGSRPYVRADQPFDYSSPAYRYGYESGGMHSGRKWEEVEPELEKGWESARGSSRSTWQEMKDAVKDAWQHITGGEHDRHRRTSDGTVSPDVRL